MANENAVVLSSFKSEMGATIFGIIKSRRLYVRATLDGRKVHLPPLSSADAEKLGTMQAKFMNLIRETEKAEGLL